MSWALYLINESKSVHISVGKVHESEFIQASEEIGKCLEGFTDEEFCNVEDIRRKKIVDLNVDDVSAISRSIFNYQRLLLNIENMSLAALMLHRRWVSEEDKLKFEVDPDLTGKSQEL